LQSLRPWCSAQRRWRRPQWLPGVAAAQAVVVAEATALAAATGNINLSSDRFAMFNKERDIGASRVGTFCGRRRTSPSCPSCCGVK